MLRSLQIDCQLLSLIYIAVRTILCHQEREELSDQHRIFGIEGISAHVGTDQDELL